ncbi:MAG: hypothetical protein OEX02_02235 [Cyclobacteriaceae bacterium]|nr:hypothetical protein [Cyclobacteriaceae bacterium]
MSRFASPNDFFIKINQIYHLIIATPLLAFIYLYLEKREETWIAVIHDQMYLEIISYTMAPTAVALAFLGFKLFKDRIDKSFEHKSLTDKLSVFSNAFLIQQTFFSLASATSILGLYLTGNNMFAILYVIMLFITSIQRPSASKVSHALKLPKEQREILTKKKPFNPDE